MASHPLHRVQIPWEDIGTAMQALDSAARGAWHALPLGNRVVIDCASGVDARLLLKTFAHARSLRIAQDA